MLMIFGRNAFNGGTSLWQGCRKNSYIQTTALCFKASISNEFYSDCVQSARALLNKMTLVSCNKTLSSAQEMPWHTSITSLDNHWVRCNVIDTKFFFMQNPAIDTLKDSISILVVAVPTINGCLTERKLIW